MQSYQFKIIFRHRHTHLKKYTNVFCIDENSMKIHYNLLESTILEMIHLSLESFNERTNHTAKNQKVSEIETDLFNFRNVS